MNNLFYDTESCGFYGPTILIQWAIENESVKLHYVFDEPVKKTLDLIEKMMDYRLIGFNLSHDSYHLHRTYNVLKELPLLHKPEPIDIYDIESECLDKYCLKPKGCLDLMLVGRKGEFQSAMRQKDIVLRKFPKVLATEVVSQLEQIEIPAIMFAKTKRGYVWEIRELIDGDNRRELTNDLKTEGYTADKDFVNIRLKFAPSTSMKNIMKMLGEETDTIDQMMNVKRPEEYSWYPNSGEWINVIGDHLYAWKHDERRVIYAEKDVIFTRKLYNHFNEKSPFPLDPEWSDEDSDLAHMVGGLHWKGFAIDKPKVKKRYESLKLEAEETKKLVNVNAPTRVKAYLQEVMDDMEKAIISDTSKETLNSVADHPEDWKHNPALLRRIKLVLDGRKTNIECGLFKKLLKAGRLHAQFKVVGTKSNRMAGGSSESDKAIKGGSVNPQGIGHDKNVRECFLFAQKGEILNGGDFDSFEITIAAAEYNDEELTATLKSGKSFHGLYGEVMYGIPYDFIMENKSVNEREPLGYYQRAKKGGFAKLYGAMEFRQTIILGLPEEVILEKNLEWEEKYRGIKESKEALYRDFSALKQSGGIGSPIRWTDPSTKCKTFLGFERDFSLEFRIVRSLFTMAETAREVFKDKGKAIKLVRRDRVQTANGAASSALFGAAFGLQSAVFRAAANHKIQSPGGQITKRVQNEIWKIQPCGIGKWLVMTFNAHDEIMSVSVPEVVSQLKQSVDKTVESFRDKVPLISMKWETGLKNWSEK